ncbi:MAG: lipopolysaccharide biosynthesis protein [Promethearchaeota archaeon]|jgi:O-antigen/teichoic acid export membrane protein
MLGRKTFLSVISLIFIRLIQGIILIIAVNRFTDPTVFGYVRGAHSLLAFFLFFSDLNLSTAHLKLMAEEKDKNIAFSTYFILKIILIIISSIIFILVIFFSVNTNIISNNLEQISVIIVIFFDRIILSMLMVYYFSFQATFKIAKKELATIIGQMIGLIFALISILILNNFILYLLNTAISNLFSLALCIFYGRDFKLTKVRRDLLLRYFKLNIVFVLPFFMNVIVTNMGPLIFLQSYNDALLGIYYVIASFFLMIQGIEQVLRSLLIPNYSILIRDNKLEEIRKSINLFEKYTAVLNGTIIVLGIIFGDYFLKLFFGQVYFENGMILYFGYLVSLISFSILGPYTPLIVASEKFKVYTFNLLISLIFAISSWILFIPLLNIVGINLGTWISVIPQTVFIRYYCFKYFKTGKLSRKSVWNLVVIIAMIFFSFYIFSLNFQFFIRIIFSVIILVSYLGFLLYTKLLTREDFKYFMSVINPKEMIEYIKKETSND